MAAPPTTFDVFLSYDHDDEHWADRVRAALRPRGVAVWIDSTQVNPADLWLERIETGLKSSRVFAVIVTASSNRSRWVRNECYAAFTLANSDRGLPMVPLLMEDVELPVFLSIRQWVDLRDPDRFDAGMERLYQCIAERREGPAGPVVNEGAPREDRDGVPAAELAYLTRELDRESETVRETWRIRATAVALGLILGFLGYWVLAPPGGAGKAAFALCSALVLGLVLGLVSWSATIARMNSARSKQTKLQFFRDKIEQCRGRREPSCERVQTEFWRVVHGDTGMVGT